MHPARRSDGWYPYLVLLVSLFLMVAGTGSVYLMVAALKPIAAEFDWPRTVPSMAYALQYIGGGLGGIVMGYWLDRAGMARPACLGGVMIGSGAVLTYWVQEAWHLYAIYGLMMGLTGRATLFSPLMINITRWFERRRGMAVGIVGGGQAIAGATWPVLFQSGISSIGWRGTSLLYGVFVLLTMVPLSLVFLRSHPGASPPGRAPRRVPGRALDHAPDSAPAAAAPDPPGAAPRGLLALLCTAIIGCCVAMSLPLAHLLSHASDVGYRPADGARMLSVMLICAAFSSMVGLGFLSTRFGGLRTLGIFSLVQAVTLGLFPGADTLPELYLVAACFGLGYGGILPSYPIIVREYLPGQTAGSRTGLVVFFGTLGMALGSGLGGLAFDLTGSYAPAFYVGVAFNAANLVIIGYLLRQAPPPRYAFA